MVEDGFTVQEYEYEIFPGVYFSAVAGWAVKGEEEPSTVIVQSGSSVVLLDSPVFTCGELLSADDIACAAIANNPQYTGAWFYCTP